MIWTVPLLDFLSFGRLKKGLDKCDKIGEACDRMEAKLDKIELRFRERQRLAELYRQEHPDEFNERGEWIGSQPTVPFNAPPPPPPNPFAGVGRKLGDEPALGPL